MIGWGLLSILAAPAFGQAESEYYAELLRKQTATVEDAVRLVARYKGYARNADMADELDFLWGRQVRFRKDILKIQASPLTAGNAAHLLIEASGLRGGVMARVFRSNQRYALRQAAHLGLMPDDAVVDDILSGRDLLGLMSKLSQMTPGKSHDGP